MSHDLNDTLIFVKVVELGSFVAAAKVLDLPKTTVSRRVQALEARLGAQLLHRTTRKLGLTEAGNIYFEHCQHISLALNEAESAIGQLQSGPRGWLRMTAPYALGIDWIAPLLGEFHARHPEVRVEMILTNDPLDMIEQEIDVALRAGSLPDSNLVARKLGTFHTQLYASPAYIARHGEPLHPDELQHHRTLAMQKNRRAGHFYWPLTNGGELTEFRINPILVANDTGPLNTMLVNGDGLMLTGDFTVKAYVERGYLQRVLPAWSGPDYDFNAVFPRGQSQSPKIRAFVDFLLERFNFDIDYMSERCPTLCPLEEGLHENAAVSSHGAADRQKAVEKAA